MGGEGRICCCSGLLLLDFCCGLQRPAGWATWWTRERGRFITYNAWLGVGGDHAALIALLAAPTWRAEAQDVRWSASQSRTMNLNW